MKINNKLSSCLIGLLLLNFTQGCRTTPEGDKVIDVDRVARICGTASYLGGSLYLLKNPQDRQVFVLAASALHSLEVSENYDAAALAQALQGLNIRELRGAEGAIYIQAALYVWDEALDLLVPVRQQELVKAIIPQIRSGIVRALNDTSVN